MIELHLSDGVADAYVARPQDADRAQTFPGVLLYQDAIGLRPRLEDMADRIAGWGFVVLVPNVLYRSGRTAELAPEGPLDTAEKREAFMGPAMQRVQELTPERIAADADAWITALRSLPDVREPFGVVGYCMGARLAVATACRHADVVRACAGFHGGRLVSDSDDSPHRALPQANAEFLFGHADQDASMTPDNVAALSEALTAAGLPYRNEIYPGASHGYTMSDTAVYDEAATERHFTELYELLTRVLGS